MAGYDLSKERAASYANCSLFLFNVKDVEMQLFGTISQIVTIILAFVVIGIIIKRKAWQQYRWFSIYICYELFEVLLRYILLSRYGNGAVYGYWYWRMEIIDVVLAIASVTESWLRIFKLFTKIWWFQAMLWCGLSMLLLYWCLVVLKDHTIKGKLVLLMVWKADLIASYIPVAIGFVYFGLLRFFRLGRPRRETGVILGMMVAQLFGLITEGLHGAVSRQISTYSDWGGVVGFIFAQVIWIFTFWAPSDPAAEITKGLTVEHLEDLQKNLSGWATVFKGRRRLSK